MVELPEFAKYAWILKNFVASKETTRDRVFLMKDPAMVERAVGLVADCGIECRLLIMLLLYDVF